jgi:signal transduction histidine kinase
VLTDRQAKGTARRYVIAFSAAASALVVRAALTPLVGNERFPFFASLIAVIYCAFYCGVGPSTAAAIFSILATWFFFLPPHFSFRLQQQGYELQMLAAWSLLSTFAIVVGESNRRVRENLEERVRARTRELAAQNKEIHELAARLLDVQDQERRRVARELHDGVGQTLAALAINVSIVAGEKSKLTPKAQAYIAETEGMLEGAITEIRNMSYFLHPPMLDELGLETALRAYVDGFAARTGIQANLEVPREFGRLQPAHELALFRVTQECLTNVYRHAKSASMAIRIISNLDGIALEVSDQGCGISREMQEQFNAGQNSSVGLRGMRERLHDLGGTLAITSDSNGTVVRAVLPVKEVPIAPLQSA